MWRCSQFLFCCSLQVAFCFRVLGSRSVVAGVGAWPLCCGRCVRLVFSGLCYFCAALSRLAFGGGGDHEDFS
jgi:hypothetical protein